MLRERLSPEQIAGKLRSMNTPNLIDTYVCRKTIYDATATSAVKDFSAALNGMPQGMRKSITYNQGREMARHAEIKQKTGVAIF